MRLSEIFTSHTNSSELQKAPNEALMEAVYALGGLFVVVVFTLFVDSFQTLFSAFHIFLSQTSRTKKIRMGNLDFFFLVSQTDILHCVECVQYK